MARLRPAPPAKLIIGLLGADEDLLRRARQRLQRLHGPVDLQSDIWRFIDTDYYEAEMGPDLRRWFLSFEQLIRPEALAEIKRQTNEQEREIADEAFDPERARPVNLDPGYLELGKLVLASTKDASHRIYLGMGIFAETTLRYGHHHWEPWPWTYPDYRRPEYHAFFTRVREVYREQRTAWLTPPESGEMPGP